jgi:uncharacterized membrane protein (UPF0127 family)
MKKSDMTYITDIDITVIQNGLEALNNQLVESGETNYLIELQQNAIARMRMLFATPGMLVTPHFNIDD